MPKTSTSAPTETTSPKRPTAHPQRVSMTRRIVIADVRPHVENGRYPVRRLVGDTIPVSADVLCDGGATLRACILYRPQGESRWRPAPMQPDIDAEGRQAATWRGVLRLQHGGCTQFCIEVWTDVFATWVQALHATMADKNAQVPAALVEQGEHHLDSALTRGTGADLKLLAECRESLRPQSKSHTALQRWLHNRELHKRMLVHGERRHVVRSEPVLTVEAARRRAAFVTGCHILHRNGISSQTANDIRQVGVEVLQVPAEHPLTDWPQGLDRAEVLAFPRAPVAAWLDQHPQWFTRSTSQPVNDTGRLMDFWCEERDALWDACLAALQTRVRQGASVFTTSEADQVPLPFWEWIIRRVRQRHPEVLFVSGPVSDAWARALSRVGFSQVRVPWEASLQEAVRGVQRLERCNAAEWRPFVEVPGAPTGRASEQELQLVQLLAATSCAGFGIRGLPEEYAELQWLRLLNQLRHDNRALQITDNLRILSGPSSAILAFHRTAPQGRNDLVVVVNCHPQETIEAQVRLPDLFQPTSSESSIAVEDLLDGQRYAWHVGDNYVRLGPSSRQAHVLRVVRRSRLFA